MTQFLLLHPKATPEHLGLFPYIFDGDDPRPAREQANDRYAHGGGWNSFHGFNMDPATKALSYPEDPPLEPFAMCELPLSNETVWFYPHSQVAIVQQDGSFDAARMD